MFFSFCKCVSYILERIYKLIIIVAIDQLSKTFLINYLQNISNKTYTLTPNFNLVYVWNYGISFGAFSNHSLSNVAFFIINLFIISYLLLVRFKLNNKIQNFSYDLIIGGAIGNLMDRAIRGGVFDFIYIHYKEYNFPIFNCADMFISLGVIILVCENFLYQKHKKSVAQSLFKDYDKSEKI